MSLEELIYGCQKNDSKSQEQLYRLYSPKLLGICLKYSRNYADAQDNLQDGFLIIFDKIKQYKNTGSFEGWARRVMINNVLQTYKNISFLEIVSDNIPDDVEVEIDDLNVSLEFLMKIIQELPDQYKLVFNLYVIDDYSHKEISEALNIALGTSKSNLSRAKLILKEKIEKQTTTNLHSAK